MSGLSTEQLESIKSREKQATKGPWTDDYKADDKHTLVTNRHVYIAKIYTKGNDAAFIAHAREDIPLLISEIERLQSRLSQAEDLLSDANDLLDDVHCYESKVYQRIEKYLRGDED